MIIYKYECDDCELITHIDEDEACNSREIRCEHCGGNVEFMEAWEKE